MGEKLFVAVVLAGVVQPLLHRIRKRWHGRRVSRTVEALNRGGTARVDCAARFRNSGGGRHRARLTVKAEGVFLSTKDGTVAELRIGTPHSDVEVVAELSMLVCDVAGRQLEILLPAEEDHLFKALEARLLDRGDGLPTAAGAAPGPLSGSSPTHRGS
ncbi:hypothetical protein CW362_09725 [Streptomyces populi]|uniref:Uncharacterized protein n=1 Tax=Streptomyces populi TaxID=2058924 RepID=A0A2I0STF5_9ACTN|nr:hypothetical protein [Streptomyces populi]PKT73208.1 hypothetical protein CW362_09725 [Streptomyces populi]